MVEQAGASVSIRTVLEVVVFSTLVAIYIRDHPARYADFRGNPEECICPTASERVVEKIVEKVVEKEVVIDRCPSYAVGASEVQDGNGKGAKTKGARQRTDGGQLTEKVRKQYENYIYPLRDPQEEDKQLYRTMMDPLALINFFLHGGRKDMKAKEFRVLVAGGGTGDATIYLAQQLASNGIRGEVVHVDISEASNDITRQRALKRKLTNVRVVTMSLLDIKVKDFGRFDYINAFGVLHHLESTEKGLSVLSKLLKPDGGMGVMLYGTYGRTGVYHMQEALRILTKDIQSLEMKISVARALLGSIPASNWFAKNPLWSELQTGDGHMQSDNEIIDLLLHYQDRPFSVPEIHELAKGSGLRIAGFHNRLSYDPKMIVGGKPELGKLVDRLSHEDAEAVSELLVGYIRMHMFYLVKGNRAVSRPDEVPADPRAIPYLLSGLIQKNARYQLENNSEQESWSFGANIYGGQISVQITRDMGQLVALFDNQKTLAEYRQILMEHLKWDDARFGNTWTRLWNAASPLDQLIVLYHPLAAL